jgi:Flp pilus assembly protein protease CpaA
MRFPFTFIGVLLVAIGAWVVLYLIAHRGLDAFSVALAAGTAVLCFGFGLYVLIRRVVRGPQH